MVNAGQRVLDRRRLANREAAWAAVTIVIAVLLLVALGLIELTGRPHRGPRSRPPHLAGDTGLATVNEFR